MWLFVVTVFANPLTWSAWLLILTVVRAWSLVRIVLSAGEGWLTAGLVEEEVKRSHNRMFVNLKEAEQQRDSCDM